MATGFAPLRLPAAAPAGERHGRWYRSKAATPFNEPSSACPWKPGRPRPNVPVGHRPYRSMESGPDHSVTGFRACSFRCILPQTLCCRIAAHGRPAHPGLMSFTEVRSYRPRPPDAPSGVPHSRYGQACTGSVAMACLIRPSSSSHSSALSSKSWRTASRPCPSLVSS